MPIRPLLVLAGLAALAACNEIAPARVEAPSDSTAGEVAFELAGPGGAALTVPVHLNGRGPYRFILDTGATLTCVDRALADTLQLEEKPMRGVGAGVASSGQVRVLGIDSLRVGAARAYDLTACEVDLAHAEKVGVRVDGLVGLNFLKEFRVTLDFDRKVVQLHDPDKKEEGAGKE
jgi:predicted aspartyl protease